MRTTPSVTVGTQFRMPFADSNALWEVTGIEGLSATIQVIAEPPASDGTIHPTDYLGHTDTTSIRKIEQVLTVETHRANAIDRDTRWWKDQQDGTVLHYHDSFKQFVRGVVTRRNGNPELLPIALVGDWPAHQVVYRDWSGQVQYGHHVRRIRDEQPWAPHPTTIFEYQPRAVKDQPSPADMEPISFDIADPTPEQAEAYRLNRIIQDAMDALNKTGAPSADKITAAREILDRL